MDTPQSLNVPPAQTPVARLMRAADQIDRVSLAAMFTVLLGWFFMDTLVVSLGSLQHGVRFYDISSAIADPTRIFFGVDGSLRRVLFGLLCIACLLSPVIAHRRGSRPEWLYYLVPLVLMILCGSLLLYKTSGEFFAVPANADSLSGNFIRLANQLARHGSALVSRHISVGGGGYVAFGGCLLLAAQGIRRSRRHV